jgi:hypothetical protein
MGCLCKLAISFFSVQANRYRRGFASCMKLEVSASVPRVLNWMVKSTPSFSVSTLYSVSLAGQAKADNGVGRKFLFVRNIYPEGVSYTPGRYRNGVMLIIFRMRQPLRLSSESRQSTLRLWKITTLSAPDLRYLSVTCVICQYVNRCQ